MKTLRFLLQSSPRLTLLTGAISVLSGAFNGALVAVVHRALTGEASRSVAVATLFLAVGAGKLVTGYFSEVLLTRRAHLAVAELRLRLVRKLERVPFRAYERIGASRVLSALADDVGAVGHAMNVLPAFAINLAVVAGAGVYLVWLSFETLAVLAVFTLACGLAYRRVLHRAHEAFGRAAAHRDRLHAHFLALTHGAKELKLHRPRRQAFVREELEPTLEAVVVDDVASHARYIFAHVTSHFFLLVLIGLVVFVLPAIGELGLETISGYVLVALYLMGPMSGAAGALPVFHRAGVALTRIEELGVSLEARAVELSEERPIASTFHSIALRSVVCRYEREGEARPFVLGPIDLVLVPGEVVFVTGGNGSGKSTLGKLVAGLYEPDEGSILWDGRPVDDTNRDEYRQLVSAVFSDFFLFDKLLGLDEEGLDARAEAVLAELDLQEKVHVRKGSFSTLRLSQGQKKRLALALAMLEDRPLVLFDEWAADQDPEFKEVFYRRVLPALKARGKSLLVITHDDRYFELADRSLRLEDGRLVSGRPEPTSLPTPTDVVPA